MNPATLRLIAALLVIVAVFAAGWKVCDWRMTTQANAEALDRAEAAEKQLEDMTAKRDALAATLASKDNQHMKDMQNAQRETNHLRDCLRSGTCGLRVAATCRPAPGTADAAGSRVDIGAGAELTGEAERAYFALRDGIDAVDAKLSACQDQLRARVISAP